MSQIELNETSFGAEDARVLFDLAKENVLMDGRHPHFDHCVRRSIRKSKPKLHQSENINSGSIGRQFVFVK